MSSDLQVKSPKSLWMVAEDCLVYMGFAKTGANFWQNHKGIVLRTKDGKYDIRKFVGDGYDSIYVYRGLIPHAKDMHNLLYWLDLV